MCHATANSGKYSVLFLVHRVSTIRGNELGIIVWVGMAFNGAVWDTIVSDVKKSLTTLPEQIDLLSWQPVSLRGLDIAWVGMHVPAIDTKGRPWVWEVVTPEQFCETTILHDDPMVLSVAQDTVIIDVRHADHSGPIVRMQVPVNQTPDLLELDANTLPGHPWQFSLQTGWTAHALGTAAQVWIDREVGCHAKLDTHEPSLGSIDRYQLSPSISIESAAFDRLLTLAPDDAAAVTSALGSIHEALETFR